MAFCPRRAIQAAMTVRLKIGLPLSAGLLLVACANNPSPPEWQVSALAALKSFSSAYLNGNTRLANVELTRARFEVASTGRPALMAHVELTHCAVRVASLEFDNCANYQPLARDADPEEQAYAAFLTGHWNGINIALLPAQHRAPVSRVLNAVAGTTVNAVGVLNNMEDPMARLVAAGALLQSGHLAAADIVVATQTASSQGWRRPLLAWLGLQLKRASDAADFDTAAHIQRRLDLITQTPQKTQ